LKIVLSQRYRRELSIPRSHRKIKIDIPTPLSLDALRSAVTNTLGIPVPDGAEFTSKPSSTERCSVLETDEDLRLEINRREEHHIEKISFVGLTLLSEEDPRPSRIKAVEPPEDCSLQMLSFYRFSEIKELELVKKALWRALSTLGVRGTIYIAPEGLNGQFAVPLEVYNPNPTLILCP